MAIQFTDFLNAPQSQSPFASALQGILSGLESAEKRKLNKANIALKEAQTKYMPDILKAKLGLIGAQTAGANAAAGASGASAGLKGAQAQQLQMLSKMLSGVGSGGGAPQGSPDVVESGGGQLGAAVVPEGADLEEWGNQHPEYKEGYKATQSSNPHGMSLEQSMVMAAMAKVKPQTGKDSQGNKKVVFPWGTYKVDENPLSAEQKTYHQKILSSVENIVPKLKALKALDIPNQLLGGMANPNQQAVYDSMVEGLKEGLMTVMQVPRTNEGLESVEKMVRKTKMETISNYRKRLKSLIKEVVDRGNRSNDHLSTGAKFDIGQAEDEDEGLSDPLGIR